MSVLNENTIIGASAAGEYEIEQSLRFDDGRGSYLSWTPASAGNRKTWTFSAWVKRTNLSLSGAAIFSAGVSTGARGIIDFNNTDTLRFGFNNGSTWYIAETTAKFRDTSAWYHVLVKCDLANTTASIYVNNVIQATNSVSWPNADNVFNNNVFHAVGKTYVNGGLFDGYLAEVNFIDGQALTPDSFGETGTYGEWKPIAYAGTYGTNGFYLPFKQDYSVEGFSTVVYDGTGVSGTYVGGTGFQPDLGILKRRDASGPPQWFDAVRGNSQQLRSDTTAAESAQTNKQKTFAPDGYTLGTDAQVNGSGGSYVAWSWDMGGTTASNTNGTITSSVRANTTYGQSIVTYSGNGSAGATVGHGLASAPNLVIAKTLDTNGYNWPVYHSGLASTSHTLTLDLTAQSGVETNKFNGTAPSSTVVTLGNHGTNLNGTNNQILYCFHDVANYSKFGSYSGNGSTTGPVVTLGFSPAFVMVKQTSSNGNSWMMYDNTRTNAGNTIVSTLRANTSDAEDTSDGSTGYNLDFTATGFQPKSQWGGINASGETYIYAAFADTREYAYWLDQSGNNNDWTSEGGLTESDVMVDSPTNNFSVMNVLDSEPSLPVSEGNTKIVANGGHKYIRGTFELPKTGKHYWEVMMNAADASSRLGIGIATASIALNDFPFGTAGTYGFYVGDASNNAYYKANGSSDVFSIANTLLDIFQIAYDADSSKIWFGHNNTFYDVDGSTDGNPSTGVNPTSSGVDSSLGFYPLTGAYSSGGFIANFGQDSSFAGNKTPQGNQDSNDIGDFYYAPPTGFLALCTANLPEPDVIPSEHFNTVLYTGNATARNIDVGFQSDLVWAKSRNVVDPHVLTDSVRGVQKTLMSNDSAAEYADSTGLTAFGSDGFTIGTASRWNGNTRTYVAWNWKAGGAAVSNTNGSATSQVSANVDAGISIATFTLPTTATTIGHGLSKAPELVIHKGRVSGSAWWTFHKDIGNTSAVRLDSSGAAGASTNFWNNTDPTSTVVTIGANSGNNNSWMMYCFHSVDGYSRVGSYTGNTSSTDGTFVHCGFAVSFLLIKDTGAGNTWVLLDSKRDSINPNDTLLQPQSTAAETTGWAGQVDFLSNGFKIRSNDNGLNAARTYIFYAIAANPFKHTNAR